MTNPNAFCNNMIYLLKHNRDCLCRDCITECELCGEFILDSNISICNDCDLHIKKDMLKNTLNDITKNLPIELVDMIIHFV